MPALASALRKTLESTVVQARDLAERGAREALSGLAVDAKEPFASMGEEERKLRNRLRARGRQLGDQRDPQKGSQSVERLVREMAYEHWHRMLFARFLAENQLLIEPTSGVSITLDECEELAAEEGTDLWGLAAQFAQDMLPEIFRTDDPVLALRLPLEIRQQLQALVAGLDAEVFTASDSLGWTYQFWQTKRKKEVNDSGVKIGADELSPVTQLFTEAYMVDFLLDNTLGAWHAGKVLAANPQLATSAQSEVDLRQAVALPDCPWSYLRFVKSNDGAWAPAAGTFEGWPRSASELTCLDPCMGSGHFVVAMFERLVALRQAEGEQMEAAAVAAVIERNLFGLEIDPRCTQIAAFNLALAAWRRVGHCKLPAMNLACSGLAPNTKEADWLAMAGDNERLRNGMERLYRLFQKASVLGSLINPRAAEGDLLVADFHELQPLLEQALAQENQDETVHEMAVTAHGLTKAAEILAAQFILVATNVPYLGRLKQSAVLREYCETKHPIAKSDIATCFLERSLLLCSKGGTSALVIPQTWLFLKSYENLRKAIICRATWNFVAKLGTKAFRSIGGEMVNVNLQAITASSPEKETDFLGIDSGSASTPKDKSAQLVEDSVQLISQFDQLENPGHSIVVGKASTGHLLSEYADSLQGAATLDIEQFRLRFWEIADLNGWNFHQSTPDGGKLFSGMNYISASRIRGTRFHRTAELLGLEKRAGAPYAGEKAWGKRGIACAWMGSLPAALYLGAVFDNSIAAIMPRDPANMIAIWCFVSSPEYQVEVRKINQKTQVANTTLVQVPFDLEHWQEVAKQEYPSGLPAPSSSNPSEWTFSGNPLGADHILQVAVARLLGYKWPLQSNSLPPNCTAVKPDRLDAHADADGIVCISPIRGKRSAADRLRQVLAQSLDKKLDVSTERELLLEAALANNSTRRSSSLDEWIRCDFFGEHCKLFDSRPFIWQIWDGNPHGFSALVNYHKLAAPNGQGRKTLELLTYTSLGDWIDRQRLDQAEGVNGADDRLAAALDLQAQLKKILEGEPPYDLFVRWKPLHQQAIGWDPDVNDGVRLNIRPFLSAQLRKFGKAGAGILRAKPGTIKWTKDRGKEPMRSKDDFPWFWGWDENSTAIATDFGAPVQGAPPVGDSFDGNRWNDLHYTRAAKEAARARHRGEA